MTIGIEHVNDYPLIRFDIRFERDSQVPIENVSHRAGGEHKYHAIKQRKNTINQHNHKLSSAWALSR